MVSMEVCLVIYDHQIICFDFHLTSINFALTMNMYVLVIDVYPLLYPFFPVFLPPLTWFIISLSLFFGFLYLLCKKMKMWNNFTSVFDSGHTLQIKLKPLYGYFTGLWHALSKCLCVGRINIASCSVGGAQAALSQTVNYMNERQQFGSKISEFQALQFRLADYAAELTASRQMVRLAAQELDNKSKYGFVAVECVIITVENELLRCNRITTFTCISIFLSHFFNYLI